MYKSTIKSVLDITFGFIFSILTLPLLLLLMLLIRIESKGSPIYKQTRIGKDLKEFTIFKLRSMFFNPQNSGDHFTSANDKRVTRIGKFIRTTSLDELPQFWNLLLGDMSLIGPRPNLPLQKSLYTEQQWWLRHQVKPGITGLAQSILRSSGTNKNATSLDLFYVKKVSLRFDIFIVLKTIKILFKKGVQN